MKFLEDALIAISKTHPHVALLLVMVVTGVIGYSYRVFAEDIDLKRLENKHDTEFSYLSRKIDYGFSELKLKNVEGQIFTLERAAQSGEEFTTRDADRLSELRSELGSLSREIAQIEQGNNL